MGILLRSIFQVVLFHVISIKSCVSYMSSCGSANGSGGMHKMLSTTRCPITASSSVSFKHLSRQSRLESKSQLQLRRKPFSPSLLSDQRGGLPSSSWSSLTAQPRPQSKLQMSNNNIDVSNDDVNINAKESESLDINGSSITTSSSDGLLRDQDASHITTSPKNKNTRLLTIMTILTATTLNLLGFTLTSPLNPTIGKHFNLPTGASFGSLTSAYPAGMLLGQFIWPKMSDIIGRKKILSISLLGSGLGLSLQSLAVLRLWNLETFLATRVFTGMFSGSAPVAKAFLADLGDEENAASSSSQEGGEGKTKGSMVAKYLGWRDAASTLSYILGPACGGILYEFVRRWGKSSTGASMQFDSSMRWLNQGRPLGGAMTGASTGASGGALSFVIGVSALASLLASFLVMAFVKDVPPKSIPKSTVKSSKDEKIEEAVKEEYEIVSCPLGTSLWTGVATVCVISFLYHVADSTFFAFYPALLQNQFNLDARSIGMSFTGFACISFLFSALSLPSKLIQRAGVVNTCVAGLGAISAGLCALSTSSSAAVAGMGFLKYLTFTAAGIYFCGVPLYGPTIPLMLLLCVPPYQRGAVMGVDGAINTLARIVSPLIMGDIYRRFGATRTFAMASCAALTSAIMALFRRFMVVRKQQELMATPE